MKFRLGPREVVIRRVPPRRPTRLHDHSGSSLGRQKIATRGRSSL